jgi:hypothetical protein
MVVHSPVPRDARLLDFASAACHGGGHHWVIFSVVYLLVRCLLRCLMVLSGASWNPRQHQPGNATDITARIERRRNP